jgi:hypothetical protein
MLCALGTSDVRISLPPRPGGQGVAGSNPSVPTGFSNTCSPNWEPSGNDHAGRPGNGPQSVEDGCRAIAWKCQASGLRREALVRREALGVEGGVRPSPLGCRSSPVGAERSPTRETLGRAGSSADKAGTAWYCQMGRVRRARSEGIREEPAVKAP